MKDKWITVLLLITFSSVLYFVVFTGKKIPQLPLDKTALYDESGKKVNMTDYAGQVMIVSYFQSWCGECREEPAELEALQKAVGGESKLKVFLVSDEGWDRIAIFKKATQTPFQIYHAEKSLRQIGIKRFPTTYLLGRQGEIIDAKVEGIHWNTPEIQQEILKLNK